MYKNMELKKYNIKDREEALINEARDRGYVDGVMFVSAGKIIRNVFECYGELHLNVYGMLVSEKPGIVWNGETDEWAEIVPYAEEV